MPLRKLLHMAQPVEVLVPIRPRGESLPQTVRASLTFGFAPGGLECGQVGDAVALLKEMALSNKAEQSARGSTKRSGCSSARTTAAAEGEVWTPRTGGDASERGSAGNPNRLHAWQSHFNAV